MTDETKKELATNLSAVALRYFYNEYLYGHVDIDIEDDDGNTSYTGAAQADFNTLYDLFEEILNTWGTEQDENGI